MNAKQFDAIVIGTGQAGPSMATKLASEGLRTAIIERDLFGGTCVNVGCTPTKALVGSARVAQLARRGAQFGIDTGPVSVDMKQVKARMNQIRGDSNRGVTSWLEGTENLAVIRGHARFTGPNQISVNADTISAQRVFINVGTRPNTPPIPGLETTPFLTSTSLLELDTVPEHLVIIGGSYIGLEFAQIYRRFGSEVTVVEMADRITPREDEEISAGIQEILTNEGVNFELGAQCVAVDGTAGAITCRVSCADERPDVSGSHLLVATGRLPNTDDLGLDLAGIDTNERGYIVVDDELQTSAANVWALGDVNGRGAFTHTAYNDYEIVAANLFSEKRRLVTERIDCYGLFIDPPLGRVGMTERAAREAGFSVRVGTRPMSRVGRAKEFGETQGVMKVVVDASTDQILGAAILGLNGDEAIHGIVDVMNARQPYTTIQNAVHIHPTVSELLPTVFGELKP